MSLLGRWQPVRPIVYVQLENGIYIFVAWQDVLILTFCVEYYYIIVNVKTYLVTDVQRVMQHYQVGILKRMGCSSVKMITGQSMENPARIVDR
jgi:hypothetical protein